MSIMDYEISKFSQLRYFCIYNPDFDTQGDKLEHQIAFYYSKHETSIDEQLRHIGVAQGVVELSKEFSRGIPCHTLETYNSCIVIKEIEEPNWWVVACIEEVQGAKPDGGMGGGERSDENMMLPSELFTMSTPELLVAQIQEGYRRWRLYHGRFQDIVERLENGPHLHDSLVDKLNPWWKAWCRNWQVSFHNHGVVALFNDYIRVAKGQLSQATSEAVQAVVDKEAMIDMIVTGNKSSNPENNGCLWYSRNSNGNQGGGLSSDSIIDIGSWVNDCYGCNDDGAFLEPSGFVYHLKSQTYGSNTRLNSTNVTTSATTKSNSDAITGGNLLLNSTYDLNTITAPLTSMGTALSNATIESVNSLMERVNFKSFSIGKSSSSPVVEKTVAPDDLGDSRFLIGLMGNLEGDDEYDEDNEVSSSNQNDVLLGQKNPIIKRSLYVRRKDSATFFPVNVVVYRRRPFTFILLFNSEDKEHDHSKTLDNSNYYLTLHRRLASLSEPFLADFRNSYLENSDKFYYLVVDPSTQSLQSSLPSIPDLPLANIMHKYEQANLERIIQERLEMIHVHQNLCQIWIESEPIEQEKFLRTSRNWWIYLTRLEDGRKVLFARKWSKQGKPPGDSSGLLGAVGRDAKIWLDEYKYYGKV